MDSQDYTINDNGSERGVRESQFDSAYFAMDSSCLFPMDVLNMSFNDREPKDSEPTLTSAMLPSPSKPDGYVVSSKILQQRCTVTACGV